MADIVSLPCRISPEGARRLAGTLAAAIEEGEDPGRRGAQIRSLGLSMEPLVQKLRSELEKVGLAEDLERVMNR